MVIDPSSLIGQPLRLRRIGEDDHVVLVRDLTSGRIMSKTMAGGTTAWFWTVTGPYLPPELQPASGEAETLDEAKACFKSKFGAWLHWAVAQGGDVHWHGGATPQ